MRQFNGKRRLAVALISIGAVAALGVAPASATGGAGPVTKTFSFIGKPGSKTKTLFNIDGLLVNARCNNSGAPVIFGFSSAARADIFGHIFDGLGRFHLVRNSSFTKKSKGVNLATSSGDFDATGTVLFEVSTGKVVTVNYAFDNATTLAKQNVCTVYGSLIAS